MKHLIRLTDLSKDDILRIFQLTDEILQGKHTASLKSKCAVSFFPNTSIRTRVTFEKGIQLLGGQPILFPSETLDKKERIQDVCGYLNNWADLIVVRHKQLPLLEEMATHSCVPVINAMTDVNHPCEVLADLYALSKRREYYLHDRFLFVGKRSNIGLAWKEASQVLGFSLEQCCGEGYEIEGIPTHHHIMDAVIGKDIICTDSLSSADLPSFQNCQVTVEAMEKANKDALLNPCPPFFRGEEVSASVIDSNYFVGYGFKKHLLEVQQAILLYCIGQYNN